MATTDPSETLLKIIAYVKQTSVTISYQGNTQTVNLEAGEIHEQQFDTDIWVNDGAETKLVLVESNKPVTVLGWNAGVGISEAFMASRISSEDIRFIAPNYANNGLTTSTVSYIVFGVVEDAQTVTTILNEDGYFSTLNNKQCYTRKFNQVSSAGRILGPFSILPPPYKPFVVYTGYDEVKIPSDTDDYDHIWDSTIPINHLGTEYIVPPIAGRSANAGYIVRIFAPESDTNVTQYNSDTGKFEFIATLDTSEHKEIDNSRTNEAMALKCTRPCLVKQFNKGKAVDSSQTGPFMMSVPPLNNYVHTAAFMAFKSGSELGNRENSFVTIISNATEPSQLVFNCDELTQTWHSVSGYDGFRYTTSRVDSGKIYCLQDNSTDGTFAAWVYGHGRSGNGYGYMAIDLASSSANGM